MSRSVRSICLATCAAVVGSVALAAHRADTDATVDCASSASPTTASSTVVAASADDIRYYDPTGSRLASLPRTPKEIAAASFADLSLIYDPAQNAHAAAYGLVWGALPPTEGLAPIDLLFTSTDPDPMHRHMELLVRSIQDRICNDLIDVERMGGATLDDIGGVKLNAELRSLLLAQSSDAPGQFREDITVRPGGTGGGVSRVLQGGRVFSKAGVSVSVAQVKPPPATLRRMEGDHPRLAACTPTEPYSQFTAAVSLVLHPVSPNVPTVHANYRIFDLVMPDGKRVWWFGGGSDLTPVLVDDADAKHFHTTIKTSLDKFDPTYYPKWKKWADEYYYIKHRGEARGIGGVFFDDLHTESQEQYAAVVRRLGESFSSQYFPIVLKHKDEPFTASDLAFQQLRRGRYAEYNLVYDKGTVYGLQLMTVPRPDAVLMSLPPISRFTYKQLFDTPDQAYTKDVLMNAKKWA